MSAATGEEWRTRHPKQLHIRSTVGWTNWLEEVGAACRRSKVGVIDEALHLFARVHGYPPASKLVCWVIGYGTRPALLCWPTASLADQTLPQSDVRLREVRPGDRR